MMRPNGERLQCPWCKVYPANYGIGTAWEPGGPVLCGNCGRWCILPEPSAIEQVLLRASTAQRATIRAQKQAMLVRANWKERHARSVRR